MISYRVPLMRFVMLICALWLTVGLVLARPAEAVPDDEVGPVEVTLTSVTPSVLAADGELVLSGTVTNTDSEPLTAVTVHLWRDARPITSLDLLDPATTTNWASGAVMQSPSARDDLGDGTLEAGQTKQFTVRAEMGASAAEQLWLSQPGAAYRIGVEVDSLASGSPTSLGTARTVIGLAGSDTAQVAPVVQLNATPTMTDYPIADRPGVIDTGRRATELVERIIPMTTFAVHNHVQLVVDPLLVDEVTALAASTSAVAPQATGWLSTIADLVSTGQVARGLYGSPDIRSLLDVDVELALSSTTVPDQHLLAGAPLWVIPADGIVDQAVLDALGTAEVILSSNTSGLNGTTRVLRTSAVVDPHTRSGSWTSMSGAEQVVAASNSQPLVQVLTTVAQTTLFTETSSLRTVIPVSAIVPTDQPSLEDPPVQIDQSLADTTTSADTVMTTWCSMVGDEACPRRLLVGAWSTRWSDDDARHTWLSSLMAAPTTGTGPDGVVLTLSDWVTTSAQDNQLPVAITNTTDHLVTVAVAFSSSNTLRIEVPDSEQITIGPGETSSVRVRPRTHGNGVVTITAQPVAPSGQTIGRPAEFSVTGTDAGRLGWVIIIGSGVVLLGGTAMRVRQVRRHNRTSPDNH